MSTTAIVWFRQDLRIADNAALSAALRTARHIVPVYVWSPEDEGRWAPGAASRWWLHESLQALAAALAARGSRLLLRRGPAAGTLATLARETGATHLFWNRRYEPAAVATETAVRAAAQREGIECLSYAGALLSEPGSVRSRSDAPFQVFTPYWRAFLEQVEVDAPLASPRELPAPTRWPESIPLRQLQLLPSIPWHRSLAAHWTPGEAAARATLRRFIAYGLADYALQRDRPDLGTTSRLSPYLHHGEVSPRQVWTALGKAYSRQGQSAEQWHSSKFLAELIWREFAAQQLARFPSLPDVSRDARLERLAWRDDAREFKAWSQGRTGVPLVDAGMRELWQTGWMHNRVRMVAASFFVKNLLHRWQQGERWFWDTLVDADLASNALNWQWVAGSGADATPWFRVFNPLTQAEKFDPQGRYRRRFVPESGSSGYSEPIVDISATRQRALAAFQETQG